MRNFILIFHFFVLSIFSMATNAGCGELVSTISKGDVLSIETLTPKRNLKKNSSWFYEEIYKDGEERFFNEGDRVVVLDSSAALLNYLEGSILLKVSLLSSDDVYDIRFGKWIKLKYSEELQSCNVSRIAKSFKRKVL